MPQVETNLRKEPKQARSKVLVDAVVEAATRILPAMGVDGATTNHIAEKAGVSVGSLYQYFPSKESILARAIEHDLRKREAVFIRVVEQHRGDGLEESVQALIDRAVDMFLDEGKMLKLLFGLAPRLGRVEAIVDHRERVAAIIAEAAAPHATEWHADDLREHTVFLVHAIMGVIQAEVLGEASTERPVLKARLTHLVLSSLERPTSNAMKPSATAKEPAVGAA